MPGLHLFTNLSGQSLCDDAQLHWIQRRVQAAGSVARRLVFETNQHQLVVQALCP